MSLVRTNRQLYKDIINKDKELVDFFTKLTKCFYEEQKEEFYQRNIALNLTEPDFENLINMAKGLKDLGIETSLLFNDLFPIETELYNSSVQQIKREILQYDEIAFNDFTFRFDDRDTIEYYLQHPERYEDFGSYWLTKNKEFVKSKIELDKKINEEKGWYERKKRIFGPLVSKSEQLRELEIREKEMNTVFQKNEFYKNLTREQKIKILTIFDSINSIREEYSSYLHSHKIKEEVLKEMKPLLFIRALGRLTQKESQKIDLEKIQVKLLKLLYLNHLDPIHFTSIEMLCFDTDNLSFDIELVDWFVGAYESEIEELSCVALENFDLLIENKSSKILNKKN